jgi:hypothetical protein
MTQNPQSPQYTPELPQWIAGNQPSPDTQQPAVAPQPPAAQEPSAAHQPSVAQQSAAAQQPTAAQQPPVVQQQSEAPVATGKRRWKSPDGKPTGLALASAGSLLAVLAFLGGTAVGHAWGGTSSTDQTPFGGPGGGRFRQFPGQTQNGTGQGTVPGQQQLPGQQQGTGQQQGSGQQGSGQQGSGQQQLPGQNQSDGQTRTS